MSVSTNYLNWLLYTFTVTESYFLNVGIVLKLGKSNIFDGTVEFLLLWVNGGEALYANNFTEKGFMAYPRTKNYDYKQAS